MVRVSDIQFSDNIYHIQHLFSNEMFVNGLYSSNFKAVVSVVALLLFSTSLPNTLQIMQKYRPALMSYSGEVARIKNKHLQWRLSLFWSLFVSIAVIISILDLSKVSEFLYFQF